jgi:tetratricopeptide (TPR) repeat protein
MNMPQLPSTVADWAKGAQLFDGLGDFHRAITTKSKDAQAYFDQGMRLIWAFNHDESTRSFAKAAELDPACAICYWGVALTVGPNYNLPVLAEPRAKVAFEAVGEAKKHEAGAAPVERALIDAIAARYPSAKPLDPSNSGPVLNAFADAMRGVAKAYPNDVDVQVLFAESMMNLNPWKLWALDGTPAPGTTEITTTLEAALAKNPTHPGANHYYIHAMEASAHPEKALPSANRVGGMMPAAGHLVHMPAHIQQRVGEYDAAAVSNQKGAEADKAYLAKTSPIDYYPMYVGHNFQFLAYSTAMAGLKAETMDAVRRFRDVIPEEVLLSMPGMDWAMTETYAAMERFGLWDEILAEKAPNPKLQAMTGGYLYARASALAAKGRVAEAKTTLADLEKLAAAMPADAGAGLNTAHDMFGVAIAVATARIAIAEGRANDAIKTLEDAVAKEDRLAYDEPADWFVPVRHLLGAQLLAAGRAADAERVYREDLVRHPGNGWALFGLSASLKAQHKTAEAARVDAQFKAAWSHADVTIKASAY